MPALDEAVFRNDVKAECETCTSDDEKVLSFDYKYPFIVAAVCCAIIALIAGAVIFVHFGRSKGVVDV